MIEFFDTSVLVSAFVESHDRHDDTLARFRRAGRSSAGVVLSSHSLAELYAVLTRLPLSPRITPGQARRVVGQNLRTARVISLSGREYRQVIDRMAELDLSGGSIYDALIVQAALKAKAGRLLTLNGRDFRRVWPDAGRRLDVL